MCGWATGVLMLIGVKWVRNRCSALVKPVPLGGRGAKGEGFQGIYNVIKRDSMELEAYLLPYTQTEQGYWRR
jgi:hypothetical protein